MTATLRDDPRLQRLEGPPELVFDAGFGELFIIRLAGNVLSPEVAGTLQYAGTHLMTPLFVVLGHEGFRTRRNPGPATGRLSQPSSSACDR